MASNEESVREERERDRLKRQTESAEETASMMSWRK